MISTARQTRALLFLRGQSGEEGADAPPSDLSQGWALSKLRVLTRFTPKVKAYLNVKFEPGEKQA